MDTSEVLWEVELIRRLKASYFRLMDTKQWSAWVQVFTPDCEFRWGQGVDDARRGRDAIVEFVESRLETAVTVHRGFMPEIDIVGPTSARGVWAMSSDLIFSHNGTTLRQSGSGHYHDTYAKGEDGVWRIQHCVLTKLLGVTSDPGAIRALVGDLGGAVIQGS